ncbi:MAG: SusC/RagA family TonB-linked outer membrane protein [Odoribacteraceae bacterium]|nr:SusC/RagA family TonB-linked outer membrane protein [Odoribacteraceae bacterium]
MSTCHHARGTLSRLTLALLAFLLPTLSSAYSQGERFDFKVEALAPERVLERLGALARYAFLYNHEELEGIAPRALSFENATVEEIMDEFLRASHLYYSIDDGVVIISPKVARQRDTLSFARFVGKVTNARGLPLSSVNVRPRGSNAGVSTDANGEFALRLPARDTIVLLFSHVGMTSRALRFMGVKGGETRTVEVTMEEEEVSLEDVLVTGYQTIRKSEMVGSAHVVKREDLFYDGVNSIEQMLQGMVPGMLVTNTDGLVGTRQKVRVRGTSTLLGNQEPVWVVDGVIQEDPLPFRAEELNNMEPSSEEMIRAFVGSAIAWLNPNDIEDITVLKDASATVLYGVKAANGVIVITTKRGKEGRLSIGYSGGASVTNKLTYERMNLMNSKERVTVSREMYERRLYGSRGVEGVGYEFELKRYLNKEISYDAFNARVKELEEMNTDWFDILYRAPVSHNHALNLSGGSGNLTYYASAYTRQNIGAARGNDARSYGASLRVDARVNERLSAGARLSANYSETNGFYTIDPYSYAARSSRAIPCFDENGDRFFYKKDAQGYRYNVLNEIDNTGNKNEERGASFSLNLRYDFLPGARYESLFSYSTSNVNGETYASEDSYYITKIRRYEVGAVEAGEPLYVQSQLPHGGELNLMNTRANSLTWRNSISFNRLFAGAHRVGLILGQEARSAAKQGESSRVYGYFPNRGKNIALPPVTIASTSLAIMANPIYNTMKPTITDSRSNFLSFYSSLTYSFAERYVATASIRSDASNRFGQDRRNRFLPVWSIGGRWNAHNEAWMQDQRVISELNLRATHGWQGNVLEGYGPDLILRIPTGSSSDALVNPYTGEMQLKIRTLAYPDLRWERTRTLNLGFDLGIFRNRFIASFEYYRKHTEDMLMNEMLPRAYGMDAMPVNGGNMLNDGLELTLSGAIVRARDFSWSLSLNTSKNRNRLDSEIDRSAQWQAAVGGNLNKKGYPVSSFWAFRFEGLDPDTGVPRFYAPTAAENLEAVSDVTAYMVRAGKLNPDFSGGLSTTARYKTLSISSSFNLSLGADKFLYNMFPSSALPSAYDNLPKEFADRWTPTNRDSDIPSIPQNALNNAGTGFTAGDGTAISAMLPAGAWLSVYRMYNYSTARVVNASFLRCNSISLAYSLPGEVAKRFALKDFSLTASVSNPFIIVSKDFKGMDPEVATGKQPIARTYSLNINVSF